MPIGNDASSTWHRAYFRPMTVVTVALLFFVTRSAVALLAMVAVLLTVAFVAATLTVIFTVAASSVGLQW